MSYRASPVTILSNVVLNHRYQGPLSKHQIAPRPSIAFRHVLAKAINVVLRSELLRILFRITTVAAKQSIRRFLIVLVSLILFLIKLIEPLTSIRKTMPRVLCGQMRELWWMNIELSVRMAIRWHVIGNDVHWGHFMFFFPLHASILEPTRGKAFEFMVQLQRNSPSQLTKF